MIKMSIIPPNNLPIFLQKYTVFITDGSTAWSLISAVPSNTQFKRVWSFQLTGTLKHTNRDTYIIEYNLDNVDNGGYPIFFKGEPIGTFTLSSKLFVVNGKNLKFTFIDTKEQKRITLFLNAHICSIRKGRTPDFLLNFYLDTTAGCRDDAPNSFTLDFQTGNCVSALCPSYMYTPPTQSLSQAMLNFTDPCHWQGIVTGMSPNTDSLVVSCSQASLLLTTPSSLFSLDFDTKSLPGYFFQSLYGSCQQIGNSSYTSVLNVFNTQSQIVTQITFQSSSILSLKYENFTPHNYTNFIIPIGIYSSSSYTSVEFVVKRHTESTNVQHSFLTALIDPSFANSVVVLVPVPLAGSTEPITYASPISTVVSGSGWYWTSPTVSSVSFYALLQDSVSGLFMTTTCPLQQQLCLQSSIDINGVWLFTQSSTSTTDYTISLYVASFSYLTATSCTSTLSPCLHDGAYTWTLTVPASVNTDTNPFITSITSLSGYIAVKNSSVVLQPQPYTWNIIPVVVATSPSCPSCPSEETCSSHIGTTVYCLEYGVLCQSPLFLYTPGDGQPDSLTLFSGETYFEYTSISYYDIVQVSTTEHVSRLNLVFGGNCAFWSWSSSITSFPFLFHPKYGISLYTDYSGTIAPTIQGSSSLQQRFQPESQIPPYFTLTNMSYTTSTTPPTFTFTSTFYPGILPGLVLTIGNINIDDQIQFVTAVESSIPVVFILSTVTNIITEFEIQDISIFTVTLTSNGWILD